MSSSPSSWTQKAEDATQTRRMTQACSAAHARGDLFSFSLAEVNLLEANWSANGYLKLLSKKLALLLSVSILAVAYCAHH